MANAEQGIRGGIIRRPSREEAGIIFANQARIPGREVVGIWRERGKTIVRATVMPAENPEHTKGLARSFAGADLLIVKSKI